MARARQSGEETLAKDGSEGPYRPDQSNLSDPSLDCAQRPGIWGLIDGFATLEASHPGDGQDTLRGTCYVAQADQASGLVFGVPRFVQPTRSSASVQLAHCHTRLPEKKMMIKIAPNRGTEQMDESDQKKYFLFTERIIKVSMTSFGWSARILRHARTRSGALGFEKNISANLGHIASLETLNGPDGPACLTMCSYQLGYIERFKSSEDVTRENHRSLSTYESIASNKSCVKNGSARA